MNALKYQTIIKNGQLSLPPLDLPEGTFVEAILLIKEAAGMDETDYLIVSLIKDVQREPFSGLGKPEALKHELSGLWSRRITKEHRLVHSVSDQEIVIVSCKFHY